MQKKIFSPIASYDEPPQTHAKKGGKRIKKRRKKKKKTVGIGV